MGTYEPCVLGSDGNCTRWSHDHAADRPSVTDNARTETTTGAIARGEALAAGDPDWMNVTRWPRAETTSATIEDAEEVLHGAGWFARADLDPRDLRGILHDLADAGLLATARAETTTATTEDAVGELLERMSNAVTRLEALRAQNWDASECQRLHGKVEGVKLAASYVEEARGLLATTRTRPTRYEVARAIRLSRTNGLCKPGVRCELCDCAQEYEDDLALRDADAVLELLRGGDE